MHNTLKSMDLVELDTCLTGLGGRCNSCVYIHKFKDNEVPSMFTIVHFGMWNVLLALRLWGHVWKSKQYSLNVTMEQLCLLLT